MLTRGHREPSGLTSGVLMPSSVHGQPALPGGGGGSSTSAGHPTLAGRHHAVSLAAGHELVVPAQILVCLAGKVEAPARGFNAPVTHSLSQFSIGQQLRK